MTVAAWGATVAWLVISALVFFGMAGGEAGLDPLRVMMVPVAIFGPVALIWIAAFLTRRVAALTRAVERLESGAVEGDLSRRLDALATGQKALVASLSAAAPAPGNAAASSAASDSAASATSRLSGRSDGDPSRPATSEAAAPGQRRRPEPETPVRSGGGRPPATERSDRGGATPPAPNPSAATPAPPKSDPAPAVEKPAAPAEVTRSSAEADPAAEPPLEAATLIQALHFPADAEDREGFRALRRARRDDRVKQVVTAAQDMLTLLSQVGLYMDDVPPPQAAPETWRRFAAGERGAGIATIAGPADAEAEGRIAEKMRVDPIFRDAADHFVRMVDRLLADRVPDLTDEDIAALAKTRSARAYGLVGRAAGAFD